MSDALPFGSKREGILFDSKGRATLDGQPRAAVPTLIPHILGLVEGSGLRPIGAVEAAVLDGFGDVFGFEVRRLFEVGDSAGHLQNAVVGAGAQTLLGHGAFEQALAVRREFAEGADVSGRHLSVAVELFAGGGETFQLLAAGANDALANRG